MKVQAPWVADVRLEGNTGFLTCPLCHQEHSHPDVARGRIEHRVAPCALYAPINMKQRAIGYRFKIPLTKGNK